MGLTGVSSDRQLRNLYPLGKRVNMMERTTQKAGFLTAAAFGVLLGAGFGSMVALAQDVPEGF